MVHVDHQNARVEHLPPCGFNYCEHFFSILGRFKVDIFALSKVIIMIVKLPKEAKKKKMNNSEEIYSVIHRVLSKKDKISQDK